MMQGVYPNVSFIFKHALIRDAAYQSMLRSDKQKLHQEIAESLVAKSNGTALVQPEIIAIHFSEADNIEKALQYWRLAGEESIKSSANSEAVEHIRHGLALLPKLPIGTSRNETELTLLSLLGPALIAAKGYGAMETAQCWERARELTRIVTDSPQLFPTLYGCWVYKLTWAEFPATKDMAREFLTLAERSEDSGAIVTGHRILGFSDSCLGNFSAAKENFDYVAENYRAEKHEVLAYRYGQDPYAAGTAMLGWNLWHLGLPDTALSVCEGAREHAMKLNHLNTRGYVETFGMAQVLLFRGDLAALSKLLAEMEALCEEHNLVFWAGFIKVFKGWVSCHDGFPQEALTYVQSGIEHLDNTGTSMFRPLCLLIQAHVLRDLGKVGESLAVIEHAILLVEQTSEQWITPELLRFKAEVLLEDRLPNCESDGEELLRASLNQAKLRKAKSWELKTANTLSEFLIARGEKRQATELLIPIYQQFDQGFDTKDLRQSRQRIASLK